MEKCVSEFEVRVWYSIELVLRRRYVFDDGGSARLEGGDAGMSTKKTVVDFM